MRFFKVVKSYENKNISLPKRATKHAAGYDFEAAEDVILAPGEIKLIPTGVKCLMPNNEALFVYPRSSLGIKKGLMMSNNVGVVDSDYYDNEQNEGHIMIPLYNFRDKEASIKKGERIAQGIFHQYFVVDDDQSGGMRQGGFGSSGK